MELRSKWAKPSGRGGADDGLSQALSLVVGPVLFAFVGYLVDQALGTGPLFLVAFGILGFFAAVLALYFRYQAAIAREDADKPWNRRQW
ncbi:MAG: AtpZ/AtpI family protein [Acidimicrobiia bacterium]